MRAPAPDYFPSSSGREKTSRGPRGVVIVIGARIPTTGYYLQGGRRSKAILAQQAICTSRPIEAPSSIRNGLRRVLAAPLATK